MDTSSQEPSHLRVVCVNCKQIKHPDVMTTAGWICPLCCRSASRIEKRYSIGKITYIEILKNARRIEYEHVAFLTEEKA